MILTKHLLCRRQMKRQSGRISARVHPHHGLAIGALLSGTWPDFLMPQYGLDSTTGMTYVRLLLHDRELLIFLRRAFFRSIAISLPGLRQRNVS
jgi:hypothetical protein